MKLEPIREKFPQLITGGEVLKLELCKAFFYLNSLGSVNQEGLEKTLMQCISLCRRLDWDLVGILQDLQEELAQLEQTEHIRYRTLPLGITPSNTV